MICETLIREALAPPHPLTELQLAQQAYANARARTDCKGIKAAERRVKAAAKRELLLSVRGEG